MMSAQETRRLVVNSDKCTGCSGCMLACAFSHEKHFALVEARIRVLRNPERGRFTPQVCTQCSEAPCIPSCPTGALSRDPRIGCIRVSLEDCTACGVCASACPFGGISLHPTTGFPRICDLCGGTPECVQQCRFPGALTYAQSAGTEEGSANATR